MKEETPKEQIPADPLKKIDPPEIESAPAKIWKDENGERKFSLDLERCKKNHPFKEVTGVEDTELAVSIIFPATNAITQESGYEEAFNTIIQAEHDFKPQNALEARLIAQAAVAYSKGLSLIERGCKSDMFCHFESFTNLGIKFLRVHNETIETLNRYRRGGEQKVTVTHIADKMAVVNNYGGQGGGDNQE